MKLLTTLFINLQAKANKLASGMAMILILLYQQFLASLFGTSGACRFQPTCSEYARQCFIKHSFFTAIYFTIKRILRCHPFGAFGPDPVPRGSHNE